MVVKKRQGVGWTAPGACLVAVHGLPPCNAIWSEQALHCVTSCYGSKHALVPSHKALMGVVERKQLLDSYSAMPGHQVFMVLWSADG